MSNTSSIFLKIYAWCRVLMVLHCLCALSYGWALSGRLTTDHYLTRRWSSSQVFDGAPITALAQTPDGYLWIGTWKGLYRFDGASFERVAGPDAGSAAITGVLGLVVDAQGSLLVRSQGPRLLRFRDGKSENVLRNIANVRGISAMSLRTNGAVLISTLGRGTFELINGQPHQLLRENVGLVLSIAETRDGRIWIGTRENGLFSIVNGHAHEFGMPLPDKKINCLLPIESGGLWIGTDNGLTLWDGDHMVAAAVPSALRHAQVFTLLQDRDANLWVATERGVLRLNASGTMQMPGEAAEPGSAAIAFLEDRERDLWIGDAGGLARLRDGTFSPLSTSGKSWPSHDNVVFADIAGRVWLAPSKGGLYTLGDDKLQHVESAGLDRDVVYAMDGTETLWLGRQHGGLTHLYKDGRTLQTRTFTQTEGLAQNSIYAVRQVGDGSVWAASLTAGVSHLKDGVFTTYKMENGLGSNTVAAIEEGQNHAMWFGTSNGLSTLLEGHWHTYRMEDGLPSADVTCLARDHEGVLWIGTEGGLAALASGTLRPPPAQANLLHEPIRGIAEGVDSKLWVTTARHVFSLDRQALLAGRWTGADLRDFDAEDGLLTTEGVRRSRSVIRDDQGFLWFSLSQGVAVVDPSLARREVTPPLTRLTSILADNQSQAAEGFPKISAAHRRLTFHYTGISLATPERVRYRYRLRGFDHQWSSPVTSREATYTNLDPGVYTFQVQSSNMKNLWTGSTVELSFQIEPMIWQRWPFILGCVSAALLCLMGLYQLRLNELLRRASSGFEERLAERTRIAQELHDTLLQGVFSATLQLDVAAKQVSDQSPAKPHLLRVINLLDRVSDEARNALRGLRSGVPWDSSLEQVFAEVPPEIASTTGISYRIVVDGTPRSVQPVIQEEACRIGREALSNACHHAQASNIEVSIRYSAEQLNLAVHDDGCGIDPRVLHDGLRGHWGLLGMRERAERVGAKLHLNSSSSTGTEVLLLIPGHIAYAARAREGPITWLRRLGRLLSSVDR